MKWCKNRVRLAWNTSVFLHPEPDQIAYPYFESDSIENNPIDKNKFLFLQKFDFLFIHLKASCMKHSGFFFACVSNCFIRRGYNRWVDRDFSVRCASLQHRRCHVSFQRRCSHRMFARSGRPYLLIYINETFYADQMRKLNCKYSTPTSLLPCIYA